MLAFDAHFDGKHLCPDKPVNLPEGVPLRVTVEEATAPAAPQSSDDGDVATNRPFDWLSNIEAEFGLIDGPADWSAEADHYLYGTPKRGDQAGS